MTRSNPAERRAFWLASSGLERRSDRLAILNATDTPLLRIGLGCAWSYGSSSLPTQDEVDRLLAGACDLGVGLIDTADSYGPFISESRIGQSLRRVDCPLVVATKGGYPRDESGHFSPNGRPDFIVESCNASLKRLGRETVDLYYLHRRDPDIPLEETWGAMAGLVAAGKVRALGICEVDTGALTTIEALHPVTAVQSELSLWTRGPLKDVIPWCQATGAGFVSFAPLGRGYLTGNISTKQEFDSKDLRSWNPRFTRQAREANVVILRKLSEVAQELNVTSAQVALAWVLAQGPSVYAIPGTRSIERLTENRGAAQLNLTDYMLARLDDIPIAFGDRY